MRLTIVTAVRNRISTIQRAIESVLEQTHPDIDHIVVDGASTDGTYELLTTYTGAISVLTSEPDSGPYDALNKGMQKATGDFIGILHSDDRFTSPRALESVADQLERSGADSLYADLVYVKRDPTTDRVTRRWVAGDYRPERFRTGWMPPHPTFFISRHLVGLHGGYDDRLGTSADYEFMLRHLYRHRATCTYLPETLVEMSVGGLSNESLQARLRANANDRKAWQLNGLSPAWFFRVAKPARKLTQFRPKR